jgi:hypothetical protein
LAANGFDKAACRHRGHHEPEVTESGEQRHEYEKHSEREAESHRWQLGLHSNSLQQFAKFIISQAGILNIFHHYDCVHWIMSWDR